MKPQLVVLFFLTLTVISSATITTTTTHNITAILDKYPDFRNFNYFLTETNLASEINNRQNITVLALDTSLMTSLLLDKNLYDTALKNVLSLHVLDGYFDDKILHQITNGTTVVPSLFQSTGAAASLVGYVNITVLKDGKVGFSAENDKNRFNSLYVKSVEEKANDISIIQISQPLSSPEAEVPPVPIYQLDVSSWFFKLGCKAFADLVRYSNALTTFADKFDGGLTVLCPSDDAVNSFIPIYKNLTEAERVSLLLYHGFPVFRWPLTTEVVKTLAATTNKYELTVQNYRGDVIIDTKVNTAEVVETLFYVDPFAVYKINNVLLPRELFKDDDIASAESPKPAVKKKKDEAPADSPGDSEVGFQEGVADGSGPESYSEPDSQKGAHDDNGVIGFNNGYSFIMVFFSLFIRVLVL